MTVGSVPQGNQARNGCCRLDYFFKKANQAFGMKRYCPALRLRFDDLQRRDACGIFVAAFGVILRPQERSHATARLHHSARRRGGVAARGARSSPRCRVSRSWIVRVCLESHRGVAPGPQAEGTNVGIEYRWATTIGCVRWPTIRLVHGQREAQRCWSPC